MNEQRPKFPEAPPSPAPAPPMVDIREILAGGREAVIVHGQERYRLRITAKDKLILTK